MLFTAWGRASLPLSSRLVSQAPIALHPTINYFNRTPIAHGIASTTRWLLEVHRRLLVADKHAFATFVTMPIPLPDSPGPSLACVDLSSDDVANSASLVRKACLESGFFYVINHGNEELLEELFDQSWRFFSLPKEEKMKVVRDKKNRGYTPFQDETLDPSRQSKGDCKEGYYIGPEVPENDTWSAMPFHGPNQWPSPDLLPGWRETIENYHQQALSVGRKLIRLLALALGLEASFFEKPGMLDAPMAYVRLLHYSGEISNPELGVYGAGAHSDYGMITLLATDGVPGLQICRDKDAVQQVWEDVPPLKGAYVVNLGDMLERWSNGIFRSTLHRVLLSGKERYSVAFFLDPNFDCVVECLPACCSEVNPAKYPPITSGHYLLERYKMSYKSKTQQHANFGCVQLN